MNESKSNIKSLLLLYNKVTVTFILSFVYSSKNNKSNKSIFFKD